MYNYDNRGYYYSLGVLTDAWWVMSVNPVTGVTGVGVREEKEAIKVCVPSQIQGT